MQPFQCLCRVLVWPLLCLVLGGGASRGISAVSGPVFRAGAFSMDVTPEQFPVIINGGFLEAKATEAYDKLHARCLVLDDGTNRIGLCVLDSCLIPREFTDIAKAEIQKATGLHPDRIMISATHTHSAPSLMRILGSDPDPVYPAFLLPRLVAGFRLAVSNLAPARVGWAVAPAPDYTHTRVWVRRPDRTITDPFGERIVRANMHPGHQNPDVIAPSGPSDPDLSLLAVQSLDGKPLAVLANYSMHYHGGQKPVSADYYGLFATHLTRLISPGSTNSPFVGIMSQGTSGDQQWMDYGQPAKNTSMDAYAAALAGIAHRAYQTITWQDWVPLVMRDRDLPLKTRQPSEKRLAWARGVLEAYQGRAPKTIPEVYAREQVWLHDNPVRNVKLQALRIGELGIVTAATEVFAISGLKLKAQSPLKPTFFIELANGEEGYIPPPEHHALGSYNTWACRSAGLEVDAETKIVDALLGMLEEVSGKPRQPKSDPHGTYANALLQSKPIAYWKLNEWDGRQFMESTGGDLRLSHEPGVVFALEGPASRALSGSEQSNRAFHFAGGRLKTVPLALGSRHSVELWFWNGLPHSVLPVTGTLYSRGNDGVYGAPGDHLMIGGSRESAGRLLVSNGGSDSSQSAAGRTELQLKQWYHVVLVRDRQHVTVYLNGDPTPEIDTDLPSPPHTGNDTLFFGGRSDGHHFFEGRLDELAVYDRALKPTEIAAHFKSAGLPAMARSIESAPQLPSVETTGQIPSMHPRAYWFSLTADGATPAGSNGQVQFMAEPGVTLPTAESTAPTFTSGRLSAKIPGLTSDYSVSFWFKNELPNSARAVTAYLMSRGEDGVEGAPGEHLGIGGTHIQAGKLILFNGNQRDELLAGSNSIEPGTWNHVLFVRSGARVQVFLNGSGRPEIAGDFKAGHPAGVAQIFLGGRSDRFSNLNGRMVDIALFDRALSASEIDILLQGARKRNASLRAQAPGSPDNRAPATPALPPAESLAKIHVREGFQVELVAAEPLLESPVAIDWDERGRLWVVEMVDYPLGLDGKGKAGGRVRILEDTDGDGRYDKTTLFAEGLRFPTGLLTWRDGVLITAAPEILFLKDSDNDGKADVRQVLFSGFFEANQQLRVNGLRWGVDNWVYCASGSHHGGYGAQTRIKSHLNGKEYAIGSRDFRFNPDTGELDPQSGPSQFGRNPDNWGNWFGVQNSWPLWHYVLQDQYLRRNPYTAAPDPTHQVIGPRNPTVFPASTREKRFHSFNEAGHFTSACAAAIYRDEWLFGPGEERHAFTCEPFHNLVQHNIITDQGVTFAHRRAPEESPFDFFASEDRWCRPVMTRTGPDGALWVVDMYRYMIEHPEWLPPEGKADLLPHYRLGEDKGRLYRVFPKASPRSKPPLLAGLTTAQTVAALDSSNGWQRDKIQMLLLWKNDPAAIPLLEAMASTSPNPTARLHALCTLDGLGHLPVSVIRERLEDPHPGVRIHALRLSETRETTEIVQAAGKRLTDQDKKVRLQLACTLGAWKSPEAGRLLGQLAAMDHEDKYIAAAIMSSALPHSLALVDSLVTLGGPALNTFSDSLLNLALSAQQRDSVARLLHPLLQRNGSDYSIAQMKAFTAFLNTLNRRNTQWQVLQKPGESDALTQELLHTKDLLQSASILAAATGATSSDRIAAAILLSRDSSHRAEGLAQLASMLQPQIPADVQRDAIQGMTGSGDDAVPNLILRAWRSLSPQTRLTALDELLGREPWAFALVQHLAAGDISNTSLDAARRSRLLRHSSPRVKDLAAKILNAEGNSTRAKQIETFKPALELKGDAAKGAAVFAKACVACHVLGGMGNDIGPNLQSVSQHPSEKLLVSILDPNASIEPGFTAYTAQLSTGEELFGIIASETANSLIFKQSTGQTRTLLRSEIQSLRSGDISLMPEGLEAGLTVADMADLIQFLHTPTQGRPQ